ncbi:hypothetical protein KAR91_12125 [Candidatus Pacearchaeota archaeon]|nr:hypothetical protein [Candidatus Pacearchaeota archaeon]
MVVENVPKEITKEAVDLSGQADKMLTVSRSVIITNLEQYQVGANQLKLVKAKTKEISESRLAITRPMDAAKAAVMNFFKKSLAFLAEAERTINGRMVEYVNKQEAERKAEEEKLRKLAEEEAKKKEEKARAAEENGNLTGAAVIRDEAPKTTTPTLASSAPKAVGAHVRETWSAEVTDKMALLKAVVLRQAPADLIDINTTRLNQMARAMKNDLKYPGVKAVSTKDIASR